MGSFLAFGEILFDCFADHNVLGGAPLNVTYHAASLGLDARIVSAVGNDSLGDEALAEISAKGIDSSLVAVLDGIPTGRADITMVGKNADYEFNCPAAWDCIPLPEGLPSSIDVLYFGSLAQRGEISRRTLASLLSAVDARHIFFDVNIRKNFYSREIIEHSLDAATILKVNDEELPLIAALLGIKSEDSVSAIMERYRLEMLLLTEGRKGTTLYCDDGCIIHQDISDVKVVDTVGAGDSLSGGFIATLAKTGDREEAVRMGSLLADYVVTQSGGTPAYSSEVRAIFGL